MNQYQIIALFVVIVASVSIGILYGIHLDWTDPNAECKKWVGIVVDLSEQGYSHLIEDALKIAEMKCGLNVDDLTPQL